MLYSVLSVPQFSKVDHLQLKLIFLKMK